MPLINFCNRKDSTRAKQEIYVDVLPLQGLTLDVFCKYFARR